MVHYRDPMRGAGKRGPESYPTMYTSSLSRPRPKSLVMGSPDETGRIKKYKSVVTLKSDSPTKALIRKRQTSMGLNSSEYFSMSAHSSDEFDFA